MSRFALASPNKFLFLAENFMYLVKGEDSTKKKGEIFPLKTNIGEIISICCLLYTSPSPRDKRQSRMPSSA